ncbi:FdrA family protein [Saxibacter everestensis]|uniref:FdrA family protein n=1 Tax=Saxibacter everestensis TaxID=2909229 RepID=A0ABY8QUA7_9MICO|nr:FdrA family protein [Brevibacteriaceae bacterium ZFBP1038]
MGETFVEARSGSYHDSVTLLRLSKDVAAVPGIRAAQVAMATPLNLDVLSTMGFTLPVVGPDQLLIALEAEEGTHAADVFTTAVAEIERRLGAKRNGSGAVRADRQPPRTVSAALRDVPAPLALISVPGPNAAAEAWDALDNGVNVMLFSDNVSIADEISLKEAARERGLLVMGPDCGTAIVGGVGLGFANAVRPGPVSVIAASGTGAQQLLALLDAASIGVRHCIGLGGRDLGAGVAGRGALQALDVLAADQETEVIVVVSKPADPAVLESLRVRAADLGQPLIWAVLGPDQPDLSEAVQDVCRFLGTEVPEWPSWNPVSNSDPELPGSATRIDGSALVDATPGTDDSETGSKTPSGTLLRGLYAGGTLCDEALAIAGRTLGPIASNVTLDSSWPHLELAGASDLKTAFNQNGHSIVDLGDDTLTSGRAHPMIDASLRLDLLDDAAADTRVGVVLFDVVLGYGAADDPAGEYRPAIEATLAARDDLGVVIALIGTATDPQNLSRQAEQLSAAGAHVYLSNAQAARAAVQLLVHRQVADHRQDAGPRQDAGHRQVSAGAGTQSVEGER